MATASLNHPVAIGRERTPVPPDDAGGLPRPARPLPCPTAADHTEATGPVGPTLAAVTIPAAARVCDHLLGGAHNFAVDRELAGQMTDVLPELRSMVYAGRAFLGRAVRHLLDTGITQILDLGCGLLTPGSVHDILTGSTVRTVHVDHHPAVVEHGRQTIAGSSRARYATVIHADLRHPWTVLNHPDTSRLLDLSEPAAVIATAVLHHLPEDPVPVLAVYRDATVAGSALVITHPTYGPRPAQMTRLAQACADAGVPFQPRGQRQVRELMAGYRPTTPGLVWAGRWRPDPHADPDDLDRRDNRLLLAAVGSRPAPAGRWHHRTVGASADSPDSPRDNAAAEAPDPNGRAHHHHHIRKGNPS